MKQVEYPLHPSLAPTLSALSTCLPHGILLHGVDGVGLEQCARRIAPKTVLVVSPTNSKGDADPHGSISVEPIRDLYEDCRTKRSHALAIIITHADRMTITAQNALLKLLEEPTANIHFILLSSQPASLLPTVRSRVQAFYIPPITREQSTEFIASFKNLTDQEKQQILFCAHGRPELIHRLATTPKLRTTYITRMQHARTFIGGSPLEKIPLINQYAKSRTDSIELIRACLDILTFSLEKQPTPEQLSRAEHFNTTLELLDKNTQVRLQLLKSVVY